MCICINCSHITECSTYHLVESKHNQLHLNLAPSFSPEYPVIHINIYSNGYLNQVDWDLVECLSFVEKPNNWNINNT